MVETCDDPTACNFGDDGACDYPSDNEDCDGNCTVDVDCNGDCGGDAVEDDCGVCDGPVTLTVGMVLQYVMKLIVQINLQRL